MNCVIPFHSGDRDQALRLIKHIQFLGPQGGDFYLMTQQQNADPAMLPVGWNWIIDYLNVKSNWSSGETPPPGQEDASGPNAMWTQTAREMCRLQKGPWLWLEPDAVPLRSDWLEALDAEYRRCGKPFMGGKAPKGERMSGVAIYHQNTARTCERAMRCGRVAFDFVGAQDFLRMGVHFTPLIADHFRCDPFKDEADFNARVHREAVLHHGDKTGSIFRYIGGTRYEPPQEVIHMGEITTPADVYAMTHGIGIGPGPFANVAPVEFQRIPDRPAEPEIVPACEADQILSGLDLSTVPTEMLERFIGNRFIHHIDVCLAGTELNHRQEPGRKSFKALMESRLDWIIEQLGKGDNRQQFYAALKKRGIECGRKPKKVKQLTKK